MNFALARTKYKGQLNAAAYFGMFGDFATAIVLYALWKERKRRKEIKLQKQKEIDRVEAL